MFTKLVQIYFVASLCVIAMGYGVAVGKYEIFPYSVLAEARLVVLDLQKNLGHYMEQRPEKVIEPLRTERTKARQSASISVDGSATLVSSFFDNSFGLRLIEPDGTVLHKWDVSFNQLFPAHDGYINPPLKDWDTHIHGSLLFPNGDVVFNFEDGGLAKIDQCGNPIWTLPYKTHHSIHQDEEGNLWVPGKKSRTEPTETLSAPFLEDFILKISPDGELLEQLSVLDLIKQNKFEGILFVHSIGSELNGDVTHLNDIELLGSDMAAAFPQFEPGDVMISLRNLNTVLVFDPKTKKIKWHQSGPFLWQHDPDFLENGKILIFDNRTSADMGSVLGGSRILELDPLSGSVREIYAPGESKFFTPILGKLQKLENGHYLITEGTQGRVFEINQTGNIVWEFTNYWDDNEIVWVEEGTRYPGDYVEFARQEVKCR